MHTIQHAIETPASPEALFGFVTNASLWHRWHPATRAVRDVPPRPLDKGDRVTERIRAGGREFEATWEVTVCRPPRLWRIETRTALGDSAITYRVEPLAGGGCRFERTCEYGSRGAWRLLDGTVTRWLLARQAAQALRNLAREVSGG